MSDRGKRAWVLLGLACFFAGMLILVEQARARPPVPEYVLIALGLDDD